MKLYIPLYSLLLTITSFTSFTSAQSDNPIGFTPPSQNVATTDSGSNSGGASGYTYSQKITVLSTLAAPIATTTPAPMAGVDAIPFTPPTPTINSPPATTILSTILSTVSTSLPPYPPVPISTSILSPGNDGGTTSAYFSATTILSTISNINPPASQSNSGNNVPIVSSQSNSDILSTNIPATGTTNQAVTITGTLSTGGGDSSTATSNFIGSATVTYGNNGAPTVSPAVSQQIRFFPRFLFSRAQKNLKLICCFLCVPIGSNSITSLETM